MNRPFCFHLLIAALACWLGTSSTTLGQCSYGVENGRYVSTITHHIVIPDGGSKEEILSLTAEWAEEVLKKNPVMLDVTYLLAESSPDSMELLVLYEYAAKDSAASAGAAIQATMRDYWPDEADQKEFLSRMWRYINPEYNIRKSYQEVVTYTAGEACDDR